MKDQFFRRWWVYQNERFPLKAHGLLIAMFSLSEISVSMLLRDAIQRPQIEVVIVGFLLSFCFFLQLRITDEFKDFEEDCLFRPYRAVPRGVVSLTELKVLGSFTVLLQLGLVIWLEPGLIIFLMMTWAYLILMTKEFFVPNWLKAHPVIYMGSHMVIMPLISLTVTACDWFVVGDSFSSKLIVFLLVSYCNGLIIELGRKIRAPQDEERGVETYSFLWGYRTAVLSWLGALFLTALGLWLVAVQISFALPLGWLLAALLSGAMMIGWRFWQSPVTKRAQAIETVSGVWTLLVYLGIGPVPLVVYQLSGFGG